MWAIVIFAFLTAVFLWLLLVAPMAVLWLAVSLAVLIAAVYVIGALIGDPTADRWGHGRPRYAFNSPAISWGFIYAVVFGIPAIVAMILAFG